MIKKPEDEIRFGELLKDPLRLFGWIFPYFIILILLLGIYFVKNLSNLSFNAQDSVLPDSAGMKKEIPVKMGSATESNQIPVKLAESKLAEEDSSFNERLDTFKKSISDAAGNPGAELFKRSASDLNKVFTSFVRSGSAQGFEKFTSTVLADPVNTGYKPSVARFSEEEWKALYGYLKSETM